MRGVRAWIIGIVLCIGAVESAWACEISLLEPNTAAPGDIVTVAIQGFGFGYSEVQRVIIGEFEVQLVELPPKTDEPVPDTLRVAVLVPVGAVAGPRNVEVIGVRSCSLPGGFVVQAPQGEPTRPEAELTLIKTVNAHELVRGQIVRYEIVVNNFGPDPAPYVVVHENAPGIDQFEITNIQTTKGQCSIQSTTGPNQFIQCDLGTLAPGETVTIVVEGRVTAEPGQCLNNFANVFSAPPGDQLPPRDPNEENNFHQTENCVVEEGQPGGAPPVADFSFAPSSPAAGEPITFDGSSSHDPDGQIVQYFWDFGDGTTGEGPVVTHVYEEPGTYPVRLVVIDAEDLSGNKEGLIVVQPPSERQECLIPQGDIRKLGAQQLLPSQLPPSKCPPTAVIRDNGSFDKVPGVGSGDLTLWHGGYRKPDGSIVARRAAILKLHGRDSHDNDWPPPHDEDGIRVVRWEWQIVSIENCLPGSEDPKADPMSGSGPEFTSQLYAPCDYTVQLNVWDNEGQHDLDIILVKVRNRPPWIRLTTLELLVNPQGQVQPRIRWQAKDMDYPDKVKKLLVSLNAHSEGNGHFNSNLQAPGRLKDPEGGAFRISFAGDWFFGELVLTATDPHDAETTHRTWHAVWRSDQGRQKLQQWINGAGSAFVRDVLGRMAQDAGHAPGTPKFQQAVNKGVQRLLDCINGRPVCRRYRIRPVSAFGLKAAQATPAAPESWEMASLSAEEAIGQAPLPIVTISPENPQPGETVRFDASRSLPGEGATRILEYRWDFNSDGQADATGPMASTTFSGGLHEVALTVVDDAGNEATVLQTLDVGNVLAEDQEPPLGPSGGEADLSSFDLNGNCVLDDPEFLALVNAWIKGTVDDPLFFDAFDAWVKGRNVCPSAPAAQARWALALRATPYSAVFEVRGAGVLSMEVTIFDLRGMPIWRGSSQHSRLAWNLQDERGQQAANGVYLYVLTVYNLEGKAHPYLGKLALLR